MQFALEAQLDDELRQPDFYPKAKELGKEAPGNPFAPPPTKKEGAVLLIDVFIPLVSDWPLMDFPSLKN